MDNNALVPDAFQLNAEPIAEVEQQVVNSALDDDKALASLNMMSGWQKIAEDMKNDVEKLRNLRGSDVVGKSFDEVGQMFLVASLTADHLQKYLDRVENATKAVADAGNK